MGSSNWQNISYCVSLIKQIQPNKILDVGVGFGKWGILSREYLELWAQRNDIKDWIVQIDGIEIFESNIKEYHKYFYNNIYIEDAAKFIINTNEKYDLIILGDVLEHFEKETAFQVLNNCIEKSLFVMLNIPLGKNWIQSEMYGNIYERHLSFWKMKDFKKYRFLKKKYFRDYLYRKSVVVLMSGKNNLPKINYLDKVKSIIKYSEIYFYINKYFIKK